MTELPPDVEDWKLGTIVNLLHEGYDEDVHLEFKSELNDSSERIPKTACAFSNTEGGFLVIGVDNDKTNDLKIMERITGIDNTDDLHKKIIDKIKNIQPQIPIENIIFKKSNIKLDDNKVIVVLKIVKSPIRPHQYDFLFYKRMPGSNERMNVEEIKNIILESEKSFHHTALMFSEFSQIKDGLVDAKEALEKDSISAALGSLSYLDHVSTVYFLHERSFLYPEDISNSLVDLIFNVERLSEPPEVYARVARGEKLDFAEEKAKKLGFKDGKDYVKNGLLIRVNKALSILEKLEKKFGMEITKVESIFSTVNKEKPKETSGSA